MHIVVGLSNPGEEYKETRHNVGRMAERFVSEKIDPSLSRKVKFAFIDSFMNKSGGAVAKFVKSKKSAQSLVVIHDDIDMPLGRIKIVFNRGSGGHKGVESIIKALRTGEFIRIKIGVLPTTPTGKPKKPKGEDAVQKFILSDFKKDEADLLKKEFKKIKEIIEMIATLGLPAAMNRFN